MKVFNIFRSKKKEEKELPRITSDQRVSRDISILRHKKLINSLTLEYETLAYDLREVELDTEILRSEKERHSNRIVTRMTLIKYEIGIREGLLQWL